MDGESGTNDSVTNPPSFEVEPCTSNDNLSFKNTESSENKFELSKFNTESSENEIEPSEVTNVSDQNINQTATTRDSCNDNVEQMIQKSPELESASRVLENISSDSLEVNENDTCGIQDSNDETHKPDTQPSEAEESNDQSHKSNVERITPPNVETVTPPNDINDITNVPFSENADIPPLISDNDRTCTSDSIPPAASVDSIPVTSDLMETFSDFKHQAEETFKGSCALGIENVSNEPDVSSCKDSPTLDLEDTEKSSGTDIELADASKNIDDIQVEDDFKKESPEKDVSNNVNNDVKEPQLPSFETEQNESTGNVENSVKLQEEKEEHKEESNEEQTDKLEEKDRKDEEVIERENEEEIDGKIEDRDNALDPCLSAADNTASENHGESKSSPVDTEISSHSTELSEKFDDSKEPSSSSGHVSQNEGMEVDNVFHSQGEESLSKQSTDSPTKETSDKAESLVLDSQIPCASVPDTQHKQDEDPKEDVEAEQTSEEISLDKTSKPCEPMDISENSKEISLDTTSKSCEPMDVSEDTNKLAVKDDVCQQVTNDVNIDTPKDKGPDDLEQLPHDKDVKNAEDTSSGDKGIDDSDNQKINGAQIKSERRGSTETLKDSILSNENVANDDEAKKTDDVGEGKDSNVMDVIESFEPSTNSNTSEKSVEATTTDVHLKKTKDVVDLAAVEDRVTKNPLRLYEVSKELRKMARKTELINKAQKAAEIRKQYQLEEITSEMDSSSKVCDNCKKMRPSVWRSSDPGMNHSFCSLYCGIRFKLRRDNSSVQAKRRSCGGCSKQVQLDEKSLTWKTVNYCDEKCLTKVFTALGDVCGNCNSHIPFKMRGRYILQRGIMREIFCSSMCRAYHKTGAKICTVCCKPTSDGMRMTFIGEFKLCSQECVRKLNQYKKTTGSLSYCSVCNLNKPVQYVVLSPKGPINNLCSEKCFKAFNFVNKLDVFSCNLCERFFDKVKHDESVLSFFDDLQFNYCSKFCHQFYASEAKLKAKCAYCKGEKNKLSMIRRVYEDQEYFYCTPNCMNMLSVSKMVTSRSKQCEHCKSYSTDSFFLASHPANKNFCTYKCVYNFHNNIPSTQVFKSPASVQSNSMSKIVISDVRSLGASNAFPTPAIPSKHATKPVRPIQAGKIIKPKVEVTKILPRIIRQILVKPQEKKEMKNAATQVHPTMSNKRVSCKTTQVTKEIQTGEDLGRPLLLPVPVPLYIPAPAAMYSVPFPVLIPVPIPIPVPVFIPTTRNSAAGIFKEIKRIQEKIPADPFEAELLMMAEMVASDKKDEGGTTDDDSNAADDDFDNEAGQGMETSSNAFGEDVLQMAIKMACNDLEPSGALQAVDLDDTLQAATIPITQPPPRADGTAEDMDPYRGANRGRKRTTPAKPPIPRAPPIKRQRRTSDIIPPPVPTPAPPPPMEIEKPDANMCLKYTFGVNAWRQWVVQKNQELEKAASAAPRKPGLQKLFKAEILQLTADELNFSLCLFVQEVRKPNGTQYAPDTIYYLCLGIQQYLFESGRIDNIFTDPYYEKFTEALDEVCCKFSALYNDTQFIVTRVEEEHLWESKQLGAHSPHVLLNTLMFFNTKHFNLITVEEHMQLSFSHIMKHWKRNPGMAGSIATNCTKAPPGSRNVLLRFYPPQSAIDAPGSRKKKVYEQQENEENPLRCPVRLYEFYLSKCPESVKTRNDVFYLLPERSCVPDSPVWYSTSPLPKEALMKMLHRIKMVKEINIAFLST